MHTELGIKFPLVKCIAIGFFFELSVSVQGLPVNYFSLLVNHKEVYGD